MWRKFFLFSLLSLLLACEPPQLPSPFHAKDVTATFQQADFQLTDHTGKARKLSDFRGKVVVAFFGYTNCPDVCPTTLADLSQMMKLLGKDADKVQVLFVSVDPERDTTEKLAKYISGFAAGFLALSGSSEATAKAATAFNVNYKKQPLEEGYYVDHTMGTFLVDTTGKIRLHAPHAQRTEWFVDDVRLLLKGV